MLSMVLYMEAMQAQQGTEGNNFLGKLHALATFSLQAWSWCLVWLASLQDCSLDEISCLQASLLHMHGKNAMFSGLFVPDAFLTLCRAQSLIANRPLRQHGTQNVSVIYMDFYGATAMAINPKYRAKAKQPAPAGNSKAATTAAYTQHIHRVHI